MTDQERHRRYQELVDQKFLTGLSADETEEMERLGKEIDQSYNWYYEPIIARLEARIKESKG